MKKLNLFPILNNLTAMKLLCLLGLVILVWYGCQTQHRVFPNQSMIKPTEKQVLSSNTIDSQLVIFLGKANVNNILNADSTISYILNYREEWDKLDSNIAVLQEYYPILSSQKLTDTTTIELLKSVLLSKSNYPMDSIYKKCYFTPEWALSFFKGNDTTQILISERCQEWKFIYQKSEVTEDFDRSSSLIQELREQVFQNKENL